MVDHSTIASLDLFSLKENSQIVFLYLLGTNSVTSVDTHTYMMSFNYTQGCQFPSRAHVVSLEQ